MSLPLAAAECTWTGLGADEYWSTADNWDTPPTNGDDLTFGNTAQQDNIDDLGNLQIGRIYFNADGFTIDSGGSSMLTLGAVTNAAGSNTFLVDLAMVAPASFSGDGTTFINGKITNTTAGIVKDGDGTLVLNNLNPYSGVTLVNRGTLKLNTSWWYHGSIIGQSTLYIATNGVAYWPAGLDNVFDAGAPNPIRIAGGTFKADGNGAVNPSLEYWGGTFNGAGTMNHDGVYVQQWNIITHASGLPAIFACRHEWAYIDHPYNVTVEVGSADPDFLLEGDFRGVGSALLKNGPGLMRITSTNSYGSNTYVNAGTLQLYGGALLSNTPAYIVAAGAMLDVSLLDSTFQLQPGQTLACAGTVNGDIECQPGSTVVPGQIGVVGTMTVSNNLTFDDGTTFSIDLGATADIGGTFNDLLDVKGTFTPGNTVTANVNCMTIPTTAAYTVVRYATKSGSAAGWVINAEPFSAVVSEAAGVIRLTFGGMPTNLVWTGATSTNWDLSTTANFTRGATPTVFNNGDPVLFDDSTDATNVTLVGPLHPFQVTVDGGRNYLFQGAGKLTGFLGIIKNGSGTTAIATTNDHVGSLTVNDGTLAALNASSFGAPSSIALNGGTLQGPSDPAVMTLDCPIVLGASSTISALGHLFVNGVISGPGSLTKTGALDLYLAADNTCASPTVITAGNLRLGNGTADGSVSGTITNNGGWLYYWHSTDSVMNNRVVGSGNGIVVQGAGWLECGAGCSVESLGGVRVGYWPDTGKMRILPGAFIMVTNHFCPGDILDGYVIQEGGDFSVLNTDGSIVRIGHWGGVQGTFVLSNGNFSCSGGTCVGWDGPGYFYQYGGTANLYRVTLDANGASPGVDTLGLYGGWLRMGAGGILQGSASTEFIIGGGTLGAQDVNWSSAMPMTLTNQGVNTVDTGSNTITLTGVLSGLGGLRKIGDGTLVLGGNNTYRGMTTAAGGVLDVTAFGLNVPTGGGVQGDACVSGSVTVAGSVGGGVQGTIGTLTIAGNLAMLAGSTYHWNVTNDQQSDVIAVLGTLDLGAAPVTVEVDAVGLVVSNDVNTLFTFASLVGMPESNIVCGFGGQVFVEGNAVKVTGMTVPEPVAIEYLVFGIVYWVLRRTPLREA